MNRQLVYFAIAAAVPVFAQTIEIRPRQMSGYDPNRRDGKCVVRINVDDRVEVMLDYDRILVRTVSGRASSDQGSECNAALPRGGVRDFRFKGIDGRGEVRSIQEPSVSNGWRAIVSIHDSKGGDEGYTFEWTWNSDGTGGDRNTDRRRDGVWPGGTNSDRGGRRGNQQVTANTNGSGNVSRGRNNDRIDGVTVNLRRNGAFTIDLRGGGNANFSGTYRENGDRYDLDVDRGLGGDGARGSGTLYVRRNGNAADVERLTLNGTSDRNGDRFDVNFTGGSSGGFWPGGGSSGGSSGGFWPESPGGNSGNRPTSLTTAGRGNFDFSRGNVTLDNAVIYFNGASELTLELRGTNGQTLQMRGRIREWRGNVVEFEPYESNLGRVTNSRGRLAYANRSTINSLTMDGDIDSTRYSLRFQR